MLQFWTAVLSSPPGTYFDCEKYPESQYQWDQIDRTRRICARGTEDGEDFIYCRHWECEKLECPEDEQITRDDGCKSCPGWLKFSKRKREHGIFDNSWIKLYLFSWSIVFLPASMSISTFVFYNSFLTCKWTWIMCRRNVLFCKE